MRQPVALSASVKFGNTALAELFVGTGAEAGSTVIGGVNACGKIWKIGSGEVTLNADGKLTVNIRGLVLNDPSAGKYDGSPDGETVVSIRTSPCLGLRATGWSGPQRVRCSHPRWPRRPHTSLDPGGMCGPHRSDFASATRERLVAGLLQPASKHLKLVLSASRVRCGGSRGFHGLRVQQRCAGSWLWALIPSVGHSSMSAARTSRMGSRASIGRRNSRVNRWPA